MFCLFLDSDLSIHADLEPIAVSSVSEIYTDDHDKIYQENIINTTTCETGEFKYSR